MVLSCTLHFALSVIYCNICVCFAKDAVLFGLNDKKWLPFCLGGAGDSTAGEGGTDPQEPSAPGEDPRLQPASKTGQKVPREVRILSQI